MTVSYQIGFFFEPILITHYIEEKTYKYGVRHTYSYESDGYRRNEIRNKRFTRHNKNNSNNLQFTSQ